MQYQSSIKNRLILIILLVSTVTAFIGYGGFVYWFTKNQHKKSIELSHTVGLVLSQNIAKLILLKDVSIAADISSALESFKNIDKVVIYDLNRKVIYKYDKDNQPFQTKPLSKHYNSISIKKNYVVVCTPATYQDTQLGYICLTIKIQTVFDSIMQNLSMIMFLWIMMFSISYFLALYYAKDFTDPILKLVIFLEKIKLDDINNKIISIDQNNEYGKLYREINFMLQRIWQSHQALKEHQNNLENTIKEKIDENIKQLEILQQQSKLAAMGEMIGAIAHQWRQPLNALSTGIQNLKYDFKEGKLQDESYIKEFIDENKKIIKFMSQTIDDFRNFFKIDKEKRDFSIKEATNSVVQMQIAQLNNHNIQISIDGDDFIYKGLYNEYKQVILNLINNAKDALIEKKIKNPTISIQLQDNKVIIEDNAGGIPQNILKRIFEPYFTTKEQGAGTGMGLYISKIIIEENMKGTLRVSNIKDGARFIIDFNPQHLRGGELNG